MRIVTATAIPMPALAPVERPLDDVVADPELSPDWVAVLVRVVWVREGLLGVVVATAVVVDVELVADEVGLCVETTAPSPFRTIPRSSEQQEGSLSQQKLPSSHSTARDICAITPREHGTGRNDVLAILHTESIRVTKVCCLAANARARTLRVVLENLPRPAIAVDLPRELIVLGQDGLEGCPEEKRVYPQGKHLSAVGFEDVGFSRSWSETERIRFGQK
ncbi:hypothetical protein LTS15_003766 [Exophiala xenobiotica]|nr:hypothetical protein LTS15_003766 [Exophiala xenobiotica]